MRRGLEDLVEQYRETLGKVRAQRRRLEQVAQETGDERALLDAKVWESMERSVQYALDLMHGEDTSTHREIPVGGWAELDRIGRRGAYAAPADAWIDEDEEAVKVQRIYLSWSSLLTRREAACLLAFQRGMSFAEIAEVLGVTRGTVQSYIERARGKLMRVRVVQMALWDESPGLGA